MDFPVNKNNRQLSDLSQATVCILYYLTTEKTEVKNANCRSQTAAFRNSILSGFIVHIIG